MQAARGDKYSRGGESNQPVSLEGLDLSALTVASPEEVANAQAAKEANGKRPPAPFESPTATGMTGDTAEHPIITVIPGTTVPFPKVVNSVGRIAPMALNAFLGSPANREDPRSPINGPANYLTDQAIFPLAVWATGVLPAGGVDSSEYFRKYSTGFLAAAKAKMGSTQLATLRRSIMMLREGVSPEVITGVDTIAQFIAKDPVGVFRELVNTISDRNAVGANYLAPALTRFREVATKSK